MDVLAKGATALFDSSSICRQDPNLDIPLYFVAISEYGELRREVKSTELEGWLVETSSSSVQLVAIPIDDSDHKLSIDALSLKRLIVEQMHIDPCVLWFIAKSYDGFHRIDNATSTSYIMATSIYMLVWNFNPKKGSTAGVLLERRWDGFGRAVADRLASFCSYSRSPGLLAFVMCETFCEALDGNLDTRELSMVRELEEDIAFRPGERKNPLQRHNMEQIMLWLRKMADVHINLSNKLRMTNVISAVMEDILSNYESRRNSTSTGDSIRGGNIDAAARLLTSRVKAFENYVLYLKERADRLSSVVFALFTHEDAAFSADMARANQELATHSAEIAEQAKRDSSAMKTITIITMAFLPATFFATLFAVPTLDWKGNNVITGEFWIYWAFTLPTTGLVFLLWLLLTNRAWILAALLSLMNGEG
ncbi:hypothetical protein F4680DRAFT_448441 [Xylaria scruposa]|nr:hypothetical protein F4680DRAFT_448441 [Xylaria scruposa]